MWFAETLSIILSWLYDMILSDSNRSPFNLWSVYNLGLPVCLPVFGREEEGEDVKSGWGRSWQEKRHPSAWSIHCGDGGGGGLWYGAVPWCRGGTEVPTDRHEHGKNPSFLFPLHVFSPACEISSGVAPSLAGLQHVPPPESGSQDQHSCHQAGVASQPPSKPDFSPSLTHL